MPAPHPQRPPGRLPFSVVDEMMRNLETARTPWTVQLEVALPGRLDPDRLRRAVTTALGRHPLARARQRPTRVWDLRYWWQVPDRVDVDPLSVVTAAGGGGAGARTDGGVDARADGGDVAAARAVFYSEPVGLDQAPPLRLRLVRAPGGDRLLLSANHAAFDGVSALRLVRSVGLAYSGLDEPAAAAVPDAHRVLADLAPRSVAAHAVALRVLAAKLEPAARTAADGGSPTPGYGFVPHRLALEPVRQAAAGAGVSVNDLLLTAMHLAIARWNAGHHRPDRPVRVLMAVNLRPDAWRGDGVGNYSLWASTSTGTGDHADPAACLRTVHRLTTRAKTPVQRAAMLELIRQPLFAPVRLRRLATRALVGALPRLADAVPVLSNLGAVDPAPPGGGHPRRAGLATFDGLAAGEVYFSPPVRMPPGVGLGVVGVGGTLCLMLRYCRSLFDAPAASRFLATFLAALRDLRALDEAAAVARPADR